MAFKPDAVLCVLHGWSCAIGFEAAAALRIPLHAIIHDSPEAALTAPKILRTWRSRRWKTFCRAAATRICVSPSMAEEVSRMTGLSTDVLYPSAAAGAFTQVSVACDTGSRAPHGLTVAFAGRIHGGFNALLELVAEVLHARGHRLVLYSPQADSFLLESQPKSTTNGGVLPLETVASVLASTADVCFLPMSFREQDRSNTCTSFPSKLVEYCAAGKAVLLCAPSYSGIVQWTKNKPRFAVIAESADRATLERVIVELEDAELRASLGREALRLAKELFSHESVYPQFTKIVSQSEA